MSTDIQHLSPVSITRQHGRPVFTSRVDGPSSRHVSALPLSNFIIVFFSVFIVFVFVFLYLGIFCIILFSQWLLLSINDDDDDALLPVLTGNGNRSSVNSGSENRALDAHAMFTWVQQIENRPSYMPTCCQNEWTRPLCAYRVVARYHYYLQCD